VEGKLETNVKKLKEDVEEIAGLKRINVWIIFVFLSKFFAIKAQHESEKVDLQQKLDDCYEEKDTKQTRDQQSLVENQEELRKLR